MQRLHHHTSLGLLGAGALLLACHPDRAEGIGSPEVPQGVRERTAGPPTDPAPVTETPSTPEQVRIDLSPHGVEATLMADDGAEASATSQGVSLRTAKGFDLDIGRGGLDRKAELAEIVRAYGDRFERFLEQTDQVVSWEVRTPTGSEYRFFASFPDASVPYHCRTGEHAADSPQLVEEMVEICRSLRSR